MKSPTSIKERLKYRAQKDHRNVQDIFTVYVLERILYRLSISEYKEQFTIKGGLLLYGLFNKEYTRATTDIDLLGSRINNDVEYIKMVFYDILSIECDDAIRFELEALNVKTISEFKEYHGVNISTTAYLDRTRIPVNIDIGFDDVIYPEKQQMDYPTILDDEPPQLYAYSKESIIAEKFEAIVSLGTVNSRYKDFYDIYMLSEHFDFNAATLQEAIRETFEHRGTRFGEIVAFEDGFGDDQYRKGRWSGFVKSKNVATNLSLEDTIAALKIFLLPIVNCIHSNERMNKTWNHGSRKWV